MKRLRPSLVITVSLSLVACSTRTSNPPQPEMSHNPPMPPLAGQGGGGSAETPAGGGGAGALEVVTAKTAPLAGNPPPPDTRTPSTVIAFKTHPRDARGNVIFKDRQGGCYVEIQVPTDKPLPPGGRSIRVEKLTCPPAMNDPAYAKCAGGTISVANGECSCFIGGNPPPPKTTLVCPAP